MYPIHLNNGTTRWPILFKDKLPEYKGVKVCSAETFLKHNPSRWRLKGVTKLSTLLSYGFEYLQEVRADEGLTAKEEVYELIDYEVGALTNSEIYVWIRKDGEYSGFKYAEVFTFSEPNPTQGAVAQE